MAQLTGFVGALLIFGAIIAIHEVGHFLAAKWSRMGVYEFSLGFGPALFKREYRGTLYALRIIPLGGYVRIAGMELGEDDVPDGYDKKSFFAKFATLTAGVAMNFVLALVVFIVMGMTIGYYHYNNQPVIGAIVEKLPASKAGLQPGDRIVSVNRQPVSTWNDAVKLIRGGGTTPARLVIRRQETTLPPITITPEMHETPEVSGLRIHLIPTPQIGIAASGDFVRQNPLTSIRDGFLEVYDKTHLVVASLVSMIMRDIPPGQIGGPLQVLRMSYGVSKDALSSVNGLATFLSFLAFLSVNIGFMNILPIPALDGGRLAFLLVEGVRGKPLDKEKEAMIHTVGLMLLLGLIVLVTFKDAWQWIGEAAKR